MPHEFAETPAGVLLISSGTDPVLRWDGLTSTAETAGLAPPTTAPTVSGSNAPFNIGGFPLGAAFDPTLSGADAATAGVGSGQIVGTYTAYLRYRDRFGSFSNLSPISVAYITSNSGAFQSGTVSNTVVAASFTTPIVITAPAHGLSTGMTVKISGCDFNANANGTWVITVLTVDTFYLNGSSASGSGSSAFPAGEVATPVSYIVYTGVETPFDPRVVGRQLLRNTDGQAGTYYVDIDTDDLTSTVFISMRNDTDLASQEAQAILDSDGNSLANRYTVPPNHKRVLVSHLGRMFAAVDGEYADGMVSVTRGSTTVTGVGAEWKPALAGRFLYVVGATASYEIASVDVYAQTLTLTAAYLDATDLFAGYAIRPAPAERRLIYYSEAGLYEAWPVTNAFSLQDDDDELTGSMAKASFLYLLEKRHIYRFTFQSNPAKDGFTFLSCNRGCVNNRCWVIVEDLCYMLDQGGAHAFSGGQDSEHLSEPIQDLFEPDGPGYRIQWRASDYFHAAHFPGQQVIRWFVCLAGGLYPRHALAYNYREKHWWIEEHAIPIGSSCLGRMLGQQANFIGSEAKRIYAFGPGGLDGTVSANGTVRGTATAATLTALEDASANFDATLANVPVAIVAGAGKGQLRLIASATSTVLTLLQPWTTLPDTTSVYQIGGIPWKFRSGWFRWVEDEEENPRRIEAVYEPVTRPATMDLRVYQDHAKTPLVWQYTMTSGDAAGVASTFGSADLVVDLTKPIGFIQKRMDGRREHNLDGPRFIAIEAAGFCGADPLTIYQFTIDGVSK